VEIAPGEPLRIGVIQALSGKVAAHGCAAGNRDLPHGAGETVLVVDDEALQLDIADRMLRQLGYEVLTVASGEQAVQLLKDAMVDLLVLDMLMEPGGGP